MSVTEAMSLIEILVAMLKDGELRPVSVTCPFCGALVVFIREEESVAARCVGRVDSKPCGYEVLRSKERYPG